jgi:succinate dehydrogenase/fumarate reductase flavoprotein subunit
MPVEVAPIAHYHMGGIAVDAEMRTPLPGLYAAGEAVGGANGANRLSGNAVTEALVFGRRAGQSAAAFARRTDGISNDADNLHEALDLLAPAPERDINTAEMLQMLQAIMQDDVGALRSEAKLARALRDIGRLEAALGDRPPGSAGGYDMRRLDWLDLRNMLQVARVVAEAARRRTESRGAHQREDYPRMEAGWERNQTVVQENGCMAVADKPVRALEAVQ